MLPMKRVREKLAARAVEEDGDVPGWVLISLMTAGLSTQTLIEG